MPAKLPASSFTQHGLLNSKPHYHHEYIQDVLEVHVESHNPQRILELPSCLHRRAFENSLIRV